MHKGFLAPAHLTFSPRPRSKKALTALLNHSVSAFSMCYTTHCFITLAVLISPIISVATSNVQAFFLLFAAIWGDFPFFFLRLFWLNLTILLQYSKGGLDALPKKEK